MKDIPHKILVVFSNTDIVHRNMLQGILKYTQAKCRPSWEVQLDLRNIARRNTAELKAGGFSGIIAAVVNSSDRRQYFATKLPTVIYEPTLARLDRISRPENNVTFFNDHEAEGTTAAEYFLERGYSHFAYVGTQSPTAWSEARRLGFTRRLAKAGMRASVYRSPEGPPVSDFTLEAPILSKFLRVLPRHTALFTAHDERAQQVISVARRNGISIPENLSVLGVDNDELICTTSVPPISSIPVQAEETGWRMANAMHDLLKHSSRTPVVRTCHTRIITRQSTDAFAFADPVVTKAIDYAIKNLDKRLRAEDLAAAANCSLRTLETKMSAVLHRTPKLELAHLRSSEAIHLLKNSDTPIAEIANKCGYCSASHMGSVLKKMLGKSPLSIRKNALGTFGK